MYKVYTTVRSKYHVRFAGGSLITKDYQNITEAFNDVILGKALHINYHNKHLVPDTLLFTCKSLDDAKANYPEYFI